MCVEDRVPKLTSGDLPNSILCLLRSMHLEGDIEVICATTMPDHFHILYRLGQQLSLSQVQAKIKSKTKASLATQAIAWQENYHEHRLRYIVSMDSFARYIYLNPYRKGLLQKDKVWPHWILNKNHRPEFTAHLLKGNRPPPEWLETPDTAQALVDADRDL